MDEEGPGGEGSRGSSGGCGPSPGSRDGAPFGDFSAACRGKI